MAAKAKVGDLIKEARTNAGMSQDKLASLIDGLSAADISKAERGEKVLPEATLRQIAKATGVTQKSLVEAAPGATASTAKKTASTTAAKKTSSTTAAKKTSSTTAAKKTTSTTAKKTAASTTSVKLTAAEKKFLELYRAANATARKNAEAVLKGTKQVQEEGDSLVGSLLGGAVDSLLSNLGKK